MVQQPEPKKAVALIRSTFAANGGTLKTKEAYELLAKLWGYKDWATYQGLQVDTKAAKKKKQGSTPFARTPEDVSGWTHRWVIAGEDFDDGAMKLLPYGATLEDRTNHSWDAFGLIQDDDAVPFTVGFLPNQGSERKSFQDLVVGVEVACEHARYDRYGCPQYANEREIGTFLKEELGFGFLATSEGMPLVPVTAHDNGDDGGGKWWIEVLVADDVHQHLLTQFHARNISFEDAIKRLRLNERYHVSPNDPCYDKRMATLRNSLEDVLLGAPDLSAHELLDELALLAGEHAKLTLSDAFAASRSASKTFAVKFKSMTVNGLIEVFNKLFKKASEVPV